MNTFFFPRGGGGLRVNQLLLNDRHSFNDQFLFEGLVGRLPVIEALVPFLLNLLQVQVIEKKIIGFLFHFINDN